jgi:putative spermidine/putrescine transport system permease protein
MNAPTTAGERLTRRALLALTVVVLAFLLAPILAIIPLSFSAGSFLHYPLPGVSLRWYADFFTSEFWLPALQNSVITASATALLATVLGTLAAIGLWLARFPGRAVITTLLLLPMVVPDIITAVGIYFAFAPLDLTNSYLGLVLAHTCLATPFVVVTVLATLSGFDRILLRAAASLGAGPALAFRRVMLPLIFPGVITGALFAFTISFDEVVVALFVAGPAYRTLPRQMFSGINENLSLTITAIATMTVLLSTALLVAAMLLRQRGERLKAT